MKPRPKLGGVITLTVEKEGAHESAHIVLDVKSTLSHADTARALEVARRSFGGDGLPPDEKPALVTLASGPLARKPH